jgi:ketol-acid reductoisomerase
MDGDPASNHDVLLRQRNGVITGYGADGRLHAQN